MELIQIYSIMSVVPRYVRYDSSLSRQNCLVMRSLYIVLDFI
jgi:hypothetical protein